MEPRKHASDRRGSRQGSKVISRVFIARTNALTRSTSSNLLPPGGSTTLKVLPRPRQVNGSSLFLEPGYETIRRITPDEGPYARLLRLEKASEHLRVVPMDAPADPNLQVARLPPIKRVGTLVLTPQAHCYGLEDMFRVRIAHHLWSKTVVNTGPGIS